MVRRSTDKLRNSYIFSQAKLLKRTMDTKAMEQSGVQPGMEKLVAQAIRLIDLADYQNDSIVSRTIIDKKTGTVTFFAFDEGQGLSEHTTAFDALVCLLDGEAEITIASDILHVKKGEIVIMPANKPHALKAVKQFKMILIMIK